MSRAGGSGGTASSNGPGGGPEANGRRRKAGGVALARHLDALRMADLKDVYAFWSGAGVPDVAKRELVDGLLKTMGDEGVVYRRVKTLTRKVLDVLLLLLRREHHGSDLPGLFRRLPGEDAVRLEYHEAEAGLKALLRRGFLAELAENGAEAAQRVRYAVPSELAETLSALFREETRTVGGVLTLAGHLTAITASERAHLRASFPGLPSEPQAGDAGRVLAAGTPALTQRLDPDLRGVLGTVVERHGGIVERAQWSTRGDARDPRWNRRAWAPALEGAGLGTVARLSLADYGVAVDDEVTVVFREPLEDLLARRDAEHPAPELVLRSGPDLMSDLCWFLEHVRRVPVKTARDGEVYKAGLKRIQDGFVTRETVLAGPAEVWAEVRGAAEHLALAAADGEGFLEVRPEAERFVRLPLERKIQELYRLALEQAGPAGRSLHQHELRKVLAETLAAEPERWWWGRSLATVTRHRYLSTLDQRGIRERHRDRFFSAYFSGRETLSDLLGELESYWLPRLYLFGLVDAGVESGPSGERAGAWRLSALGARLFGSGGPDVATGVMPLRVNPDFEVVVLPEGDVSDVVHRLDGFAPRSKSGDVVHFRLTREGLETAVMGGRSLEEFLRFLEARSRGGVPQNVAYSLKGWAQGVSFASLERGVVLKASDEAALDRILAVAGMAALVVRRLSPREALLSSEPLERKLVTALREQGVQLQGP